MGLVIFFNFGLQFHRMLFLYKKTNYSKEFLLRDDKKKFMYVIIKRNNCVL